MAKTSFYLDTRRTKPGRRSVLKIAISNGNSRAYISLHVELLPNQWDAKRSLVVNHPNEKMLNYQTTYVMQQVEHIIFILTIEGRLHSMTAKEIKDEFERRQYPQKTEEVKKQTEEKKVLFIKHFLSFAESKKKSTRQVYMQTYSRLVAFMGNKLDTLKYEDITTEWLTRFDNFMAETAPSKNARNIHLRNIRAVFNEAIADNITTFYPFRRFKIRPVATRKRCMKVEDLRTLFSYPAEKHARYYIDIFMLLFMLIGINVVDLCNLKEIVDGRITFHRAKTNRLYSIKIEPEALEIIERYRGNGWLLNILDRYTDHNDFTRRLNSTLQKVGPVKRVGLGGKKIYSPLFPEITSYWSRHSWATIAASLDIPRDTIAHALGHGTNTVTDIYIDYDQNKVDEANRRVLDWVLYGKR